MRRQILGLVAVMAAFLVAPLQALALADAGVVLAAQGAVSAKAPDGTVRVLERRGAVNVGDVLMTGADGKAQLRMKDGAVLSLGENSELAVAAYSHKAAGDDKDEAVLKMAKGALVQISGEMEKSAYRLETPVSTLGIRGTIFQVQFSLETGELAIVVADGSVEVMFANGTKVPVAAGQKLVFKADGSVEVVAADPTELAAVLATIEVTEADSVYVPNTDTVVTDTAGAGGSVSPEPQ